MTDASEKSYALEARLDQLVSGGWTGPFFAAKTGDTSRASTSLNDDPDLVLTVPAPGNYWVASVVSYRGGTGVSEGDLNFGWVVTAGQFVMAVSSQRLSDGAYSTARLTSGDTRACQTTGTSNHVVLSAQGQWTLSGTTPGTLTFRWCKNTAADGTTNTVVEIYSFLAAIRGA